MTTSTNNSEEGNKPAHVPQADKTPAAPPAHLCAALKEHPPQDQTSNIGPPTPATAASPTSATDVSDAQRSTVSLLERPGNRALWDSLPRSLAEVEQRQAEEEEARAAMSADLARVSLAAEHGQEHEREQRRYEA